MRSILTVITMFAAHLAAQLCPDKEVMMPVAVEVMAGYGAESGLAASDFILSGKGVQPSPLKALTNAPSDIVILIEDRDRGGQLAGAANLFVNSITNDDRVLVLTYGVSTRKQNPWSNSALEVQTAIEKGAGASHLQVARPLFAVIDALKQFGKPTSARKRAIFMLGDDQDHTGQIRAEQVASNLIAQRVTLDLAVDPAPPRKIPRFNVPAPTLGNDTPAQRSGATMTQSVRAAAVSSGGSADVFLDVAFLKRMRERLNQRAILSYCVDKKHAETPPQVEFSPTGQQKYPTATLRFPGVR